jgi:hypothetical protein
MFVILAPLSFRSFVVYVSPVPDCVPIVMALASRKDGIRMIKKYKK